MAINKSYNHVSGITYFYETTIEVDAETGQKMRKRRVIGKLDEKTGKMIPTEGRGRHRSHALDEDALNSNNPMIRYKHLYETEVHNAKENEAEIAVLKDRLRLALTTLQKANATMSTMLSDSNRVIQAITEVIS